MTQSPSGFDLTPPSPEDRARLEAGLTPEEKKVLLHHGTEAHARHGRTLARAQRLRQGALLILALALFMALVALVVLVLQVVL